MKSLYKALLGAAFMFTFLFTATGAKAQLSPGDILFTGYNAVGVSGTNPDTFSFVVLTPVASPTTIYFTDRGYQGSSTWQGQGTTEGTISLVTNTALAIGDEVTIFGFTAQRNGSSVGTVTQVLGGNATTGLSLGNTGDQIIAFQGGSGDPTNVAASMIAGINWSLQSCGGSTSDNTWNSACTPYSTQTSAMPPSLTGGVSAFLVGTGGSTTNFDQAKFNCSTAGTPFSTVSALKTAIMTKANWDFVFGNNISQIDMPPGCTYYSTCTPPAITGQPSSASICNGSTTSFAATASNATGYQWKVNTGSGFTNITNGGVYSGATTNTLTITGATTGMNGYTYQLTATGGCTPDATTNIVTLTVAGTDTWTGGTSSAWNTTTNWSCGSIPTASTDVLIPSGTTFSPTVNITSAICNNITINSGASLSFVAGSNVLEVKGNFTNNGTFNATAGKLKLSGTSSQTVPAATYKDFELAGSGTKTASGAINISGVLTLTNGFLQIGANDLTLGSSASIAGSNAVLLNVSPTSFIITNSTGQMKIQNIGTGGKTGAVLFPIGTASSSYTPLTIQNAGTVDIFGARVISSVYKSYTAAGVPNGAAQTTNNVNKTWLITETTAGGSNATVEFAWSSFDEQPLFNDGACFASHYENGGWHTVLPAQTANGFDPYSLAMTGITSFSPFAIGSSGSILPLDLLSFTGKASKAGNVLSWVTANEKNVSGFEVERASDGRDYERITNVPARANNSTTETSYSYVDAAAPAGTAYYRLKMVDIDGTFNYSNTVVVNTDSRDAHSFTVYPNPTDGDLLNIQLNAATASEIAVQVTDVTGRVWYSGTVKAGETILPVGIKTLPAGIYHVSLSGDSINGTTRFTKL